MKAQCKYSAFSCLSTMNINVEVACDMSAILFVWQKYLTLSCLWHIRVHGHDVQLTVRSVDKRTKVTWILIYYYPCKFLVETNVIFFVAFRWPLGCIIHRVFGMSRGSNCWWCMWYYPDTFPALSSHCNSLLRGGYRWDPRLPRSSNELLWHLWMYTLMWW